MAEGWTAAGDAAAAPAPEGDGHAAGVGEGAAAPAAGEEAAAAAAPAAGTTENGGSGEAAAADTGAAAPGAAAEGGEAKAVAAEEEEAQPSQPPPPEEDEVLAKLIRAEFASVTNPQSLFSRSLYVTGLLQVGLCCAVLSGEHRCLDVLALGRNGSSGGRPVCRSASAWWHHKVLKQGLSEEWGRFRSGLHCNCNTMHARSRCAATRGWTAPQAGQGIDAKLRRAMEVYGPLASINIPRHPSGGIRGHAHVDFKRCVHAEA